MPQSGRSRPAASGRQRSFADAIGRRRRQCPLSESATSRSRPGSDIRGCRLFACKRTLQRARYMRIGRSRGGAIIRNLIDAIRSGSSDDLIRAQKHHFGNHDAELSCNLEIDGPARGGWVARSADHWLGFLKHPVHLPGRSSEIVFPVRPIGE
jgi:hypothetical protein